MGRRARSGLLILLTLAAAIIVAYGASAGRSAAGGNAKAAPTISCALAKALAQAAVRPVWFPSPQPPGRFLVNGSVSMFGPGPKWASGPRYFLLYRVPGGANLGEPFPTKVTNPYLANFHRTLQVYRLANVEGGRLYAEWPTFSRYPDMTAAIANGETVPQFVTFLRSLQHIVWPTGCR
jgi:hypothetical protein